MATYVVVGPGVDADDVLWWSARHRRSRLRTPALKPSSAEPGLLTTLEPAKSGPRAGQERRTCEVSDELLGLARTDVEQRRGDAVLSKQLIERAMGLRRQRVQHADRHTGKGPSSIVKPHVRASLQALKSGAR